MFHTVLIKSRSQFPIGRKRIRKVVNRILNKYKVESPVEVSLAIVGDRKMRELNLIYRHLDKSTTVLAFSQLEKKRAADLFPSSKDGKLRLGDVVVCYPQARRMAAEENRLVDDVIDYLLAHGLKHLLGIHHK